MSEHMRTCLLENVCPSDPPHIRLPIRLSVSMSVSHSTYICPPACLPVHLSIYPSASRVTPGRHPLATSKLTHCAMWLNRTRRLIRTSRRQRRVDDKDEDGATTKKRMRRRQRRGRGNDKDEDRATTKTRTGRRQRRGGGDDKDEDGATTKTRTRRAGLARDPLGERPTAHTPKRSSQKRSHSHLATTKPRTWQQPNHAPGINHTPGRKSQHARTSHVRRREIKTHAWMKIRAHARRKASQPASQPHLEEDVEHVARWHHHAGRRQALQATECRNI